MKCPREMLPHSTIAPFTPSSRSIFSQHCNEKCISGVVIIGSIIISSLAMESQVLHTVRGNISGEAAGEIDYSWECKGMLDAYGVQKYILLGSLVWESCSRDGAAFPGLETGWEKNRPHLLSGYDGWVLGARATVLVVSARVLVALWSSDLDVRAATCYCKEKSTDLKCIGSVWILNAKATPASCASEAITTTAISNDKVVNSNDAISNDNIDRWRTDIYDGKIPRQDSR